MTFTDGAVTAFLVFGHASLWVRVYNRLHALGISRTAIKLCEKLIYLLFAVLLATTCHRLLSRQLPQAVAFGLLAYEIPCYVSGTYTLMRWLYRKRWWRPPASFHEQTLAVVDVRERSDLPLAHGFTTRLLCSLPLNQSLEFGVQQRTLTIASLPAALDGLVIAHLSDLHYTGRIAQPFFQAAVDEANALDADLVCVTGDIVDYDQYIPWIPATLGRLRSRYGTLCILGNHDKRVSDPEEVRRVLVAAGLRDVGGKCERIDVRDTQILVAGNERPWLGKLPMIPPRDSEMFRLLLSHAPDQYPWAKRQQFDLMLAGHTHGGQIRLPLIGPLVAPSSFGVRYAAGVFYEPPTWLHVTRGLSGKQSIRVNCQPEIVKIVLRCPIAKS